MMLSSNVIKYRHIILIGLNCVSYLPVKTVTGNICTMCTCSLIQEIQNQISIWFKHNILYEGLFSKNIWLTFLNLLWLNDLFNISSIVIIYGKSFMFALAFTQPDRFQKPYDVIVHVMMY